jgi:signal transduction histidine kinase
MWSAALVGDRTVERTAVQRLAGTLRPLRLLLIGVIVVPIGLFVSAAWLNYRWAFDEARTELARTTDAVHEHALKVFEINELVLDRLAERYGELDEATLAAAPELRTYVKQLAASAPHITSAGFIFGDGRIISSNLDLPAGSAHHHEFIAAPRNGVEMLIGVLETSSHRNQLRFLIARPKPGTPRGANRDLIYTSISPDYFQRYYSGAFGPDYAISIIRSDGAILARSPELPKGFVLAPNTGFRRSIAENADHGSYIANSSVDGQARVFAYRKLGDYPLYVAVGVDEATVIEGWRAQLAGHLVFGIPATLALIAITLIALRRSASAHDAMRQAAAETKRRQQLEASLHQAQKMEAVGQLTGGVAHDFNNLLTAIIGSLEMIERTDAPELIRKYATAAMRAADRGARLTQQLLAFSRRQVLRPEIVNVNRLLGEFETLTQRAVGESIEVKFALDAKVDPSRIDPAQFQSAVLNLVVNARDATPAGGRILVETRNVHLGAENGALELGLSPGRYVMIAVSDTGSGMTAEVRAQAFDPFFTTKEVGKGSGLGLSQVYGFAKQSGGHVTVESEPGQGTCVRFYLPSVEAPAPARSDGAVEPPPERRTGSVLIVEDDEAVLATVKGSLDELGYRTIVARSAAEALDVLRRDEPIDLLFSDIVMPGGMNGVALARRARRLRQDIKVLLTSGYAPAAANEHENDGFAVLSKPYRQGELARVIAGVLGERASPGTAL